MSLQEGGKKVETRDEDVTMEAESLPLMHRIIFKMVMWLVQGHPTSRERGENSSLSLFDAKGYCFT